MERLYVVYDWDRPFAECAEFESAYHQAKECLINEWQDVTIDLYCWDWGRGYKYECQYWDFCFIDRRGDAILPEDLTKAWIYWVSILWPFNTVEQLELLSGMSDICEIDLNFLMKQKRKKLYSLNKKKWY